MNGLSGGTVPSSRRRKTLPPRLLGSCAPWAPPPPVVMYNVPSRPKAIREPPPAPSAMKTSVTAVNALPSHVPLASATCALFGPIGLV